MMYWSFAVEMPWSLVYKVNDMVIIRKIRGELMRREEFMRIYELLDTVSPVPFDCGRICGEECCNGGDEEIGIYLLPGEESVRAKEEWRMVEETEYGLFVKCKGPESCERSTRPMQCRTFPLFPKIDENGSVFLEPNDIDLPYVCPLIEDEANLDHDFVDKTKEAWQELINDPIIKKTVESWNE